jgi:hypothetical protein
VSSATESDGPKSHLVLPLQIEKDADNVATTSQSPWEIGILAQVLYCFAFADQEPTSPSSQRLPPLPMREILWFAIAIQQSKYERRCTVNVEACYRLAPRFGCSIAAYNTGQIEAQHI